MESGNLKLINNQTKHWQFSFTALLPHHLRVQLQFLLMVVPLVWTVRHTKTDNNLHNANRHTSSWLTSTKSAMYLSSSGPLIPKTSPSTPVSTCNHLGIHLSIRHFFLRKKNIFEYNTTQHNTTEHSHFYPTIRTVEAYWCQ